MNLRLKPDFYWLNDGSVEFLKDGYLLPGQDPFDRIKEIANHSESLLEGKVPGFAKKFFYYMKRGYYSLASPEWSNFGNVGRGYSVSCFGSYISDHMSSILGTHAEVGMMSKFGGGCSGYFGQLRGRGEPISNNGESFGSVHFMQLFESLINVVSQGSVRRGFFSPYLPITHPDANEFLDIGSEGHPIQKLTHGVTVSDKFMEQMIAGNSEYRRLWAKLIQRRGENGYPYILFEDTVNNNTVDVYKDKGLRIYASNMCSEIALPSSPEESFVCVLASMNLDQYDEWKDTDAVETLVYFLDTVVTDFINQIEYALDSGIKEKIEGAEMMRRAYTFAKRHRALGLGALGWHSYLQSKMIPFESTEASKLNIEIFKTIKQRAYSASEELAKLFGEPELLQGYGRRNTTLTAIAPTKSSSFILGQVSQSIEPEFDNYYIKDLAKTKYTVMNPYLKELLESRGYNTPEIRHSIKINNGSVQHLSNDILSEHEKAVFRTQAEIDPMAVIYQAAARQEYVDQSQSLNLNIDPSMPTKDINQLYINAWKLKIKSLYYQYSLNAAQSLTRKKLQSLGCVACSA